MDRKWESCFISAREGKKREKRHCIFYNFWTLRKQSVLNFYNVGSVAMIKQFFIFEVGTLLLLSTKNKKIAISKPLSKIWQICWIPYLENCYILISAPEPKLTKQRVLFSNMHSRPHSITACRTRINLNLFSLILYTKVQPEKNPTY